LGNVQMLEPAALVAALDARVLPLVAELSQAVAERAADLPHAERSLRLAVTLLAKALLQHLPRLHEGPAFLPLWEAILAALQRAVKVRFLPRRNSAHSEVPVAGCDVGRHLRPPLHTCDSELSIRFAPSRSNPTQRTASSANTSCAVP
jgi:hypothetical protein